MPARCIRNKPIGCTQIVHVEKSCDIRRYIFLVYNDNQSKVILLRCSSGLLSTWAREVSTHTFCRYVASYTQLHQAHFNDRLLQKSPEFNRLHASVYRTIFMDNYTAAMRARYSSSIYHSAVYDLSQEQSISANTTPITMGYT
jgi:hypothetical protein